MTFFVLVSPALAPEEPTAHQDVRLSMESWDGSVKLNLSDGPVRWKPGATGLEVAPSDLLTAATPGVAGRTITGVSYPSRPVLLPITIGGRDWVALNDAVERLRTITDPGLGMTQDGSFRLVATTPRGTRQLCLAYRSGLEGLGVPSHVRQNYVLDLEAVQPFAEDRELQTRPFRLVQDTAPFLGGVWGQIRIVSSRIAGPTTPVKMTSAVPVYPTFRIVGPASSVLITGSNGLRLDVPDGVEAGDVFEVVSNPRGKDVRLNGQIKAGMLARGSRLAPFGFGTTELNVAAPDATADTRLIVSWRGLYRSLL